MALQRLLSCAAFAALGIGTHADDSKGASLCFEATVSHLSAKPVVSYVDGNSDFAQVFNPSWIVASPGTGGKAGLMIRTQNCTKCGYGGECCRCHGAGSRASVLTFAELEGEDGDLEKPPSFKHVSKESVVFAPVDKSDEKGDEDPRIAYDPSSGIYYMLYTCYGDLTATMCLATAKNPTSADSWVRYGPVGFGQNTKSGAMLIREQGPHYLIWGAGKKIHITQSYNLSHWTPGTSFINQTAWGNTNVEAGPPPMKLSTGDYIFFFNSWNADWPAKGPGYQPAWVVLSGKDPSKIIARAQRPLFSPQARTWLEGKPPYTCNVPNVVFLEAAHPIGGDAFRIYFGGSDAVIGTAVVKIQTTDCTYQAKEHVGDMV